MKIEDASPDQVAYVATRMRERDLAEFSAVTNAETRLDLALLFTTRYASNSGLFCASAASEPIAIGSVVMGRPNVGTLLFFATDAFPRIALPLTRWITRELFPRIREAGVHRIECASIEGYDEAHRWIGLLGLEREAVLQKFGKDGQTFHQFAWVAA